MKKNEKGMTLVEVVVAFAILMIGLSMLYKATLFSMNQINMAKIIQKDVDTVVSEFYEIRASEIGLPPGTPNAIKFSMGGTDMIEMRVLVGTYESEKGYNLNYFQPGGGS